MPKTPALPDDQFQNNFYAGIRRHSVCATRKLAAVCAVPISCVKCLCMPFFLNDELEAALHSPSIEEAAESPPRPMSPKRYAPMRPHPPDHQTSLLNVLEPLQESPQHLPKTTQAPTPQTLPAHTLLHAARKGKQRMRLPSAPVPLPLLRTAAAVPDVGTSTLDALPQ